MTSRRSTAELFEKIPTVIFESSGAAAAALAQEVRALVETRQKEGKSVVLGLATGSTPVPFYRELIRLHREEGLSLKNVVTFNLDEYHGLAPTHPESYFRFMREQLFDHVDIPAENIHLPSGLVPSEAIFDHCHAYEEMIDAAGGIDFQILGIGRTGHIGFNEPGSSRDSLTRRITLDRITRQDAAGDFRGEENVPRFAITMGVGTILRARKIVLMAWGEGKAEVVARAVEGTVTEAVSASFLQEHGNARFFVDSPASRELTRVKLPWLTGPVRWSPDETRRAVCWLSSSLKRPVLKLTDEDYNEHGLSDLLSEQGPAYQLNIRIFNQLQHTISGWPGGKPGADDTFRPERAKPYPKRCLIFSPEPQDAVVSIGATIDRLVEQGHEVLVVCMTSGNLRVPDSEADKFASVLLEVGETFAEGWSQQAEYARMTLQSLTDKGEVGEDPASLRQLKSLILRGEVRDAALALGLPHDRLKFLDLPFYEKGRYRRFVLEVEDERAVTALLREFMPHQIYLTGSASDPSSVAALCAKLVEQGLASLQGEAWVDACSVWLYRGREKALEPWQIAMAMPISPMQLERKARALARCQSLTSIEQEVTKVNQKTAEQYDELGLANYEAIESFQRRVVG